MHVSFPVNKKKLLIQTTYKKPTPEEKRIEDEEEVFLLTKKLRKIYLQMRELNTDVLLLKIDPSIHSLDIIEQVQAYHPVIREEIERYKSQVKEIKRLKEDNKILKLKLEMLVKPSKETKERIEEIERNKSKREKKEQQQQKLQQQEPTDNTKSQQVSLTESKKKQKSVTKKENKPIIDYRVKIRSLEKDIVYTYQNYNHTKSKNTTLMEELDELRNQLEHKTKKLEELKKTLQHQENQYYMQKQEIEKDLDNKDQIDLNEKIKATQKELERTNLEMVEKIKETDEFCLQKQAQQKNLQHEEHKIKAKSEKLKIENKKQIKEFNDQYKSDIEKVKSFTESSIIIDTLDIQKITNLEEISRKMFNETKTENIQSFVDYFIKSCDEYKAFQESITNLNQNIKVLEKEVDELEYIINFCEQNLEVVNDKNFDDKEIEEINTLKKCTDMFVDVQYEAINKSYQKFSDELSKMIVRTQQEQNEIDNKHTKFLDTYVEYLNKAQEEFKRIANMVSKKKPSKIGRDVFDFNKWDSKWDKAEKIKENVKKNYEKGGIGSTKFEFKGIKDMVDDIMLKGEKNK